MPKKPRPPAPINLTRPADRLASVAASIVSLVPGVGGIMSSVISNLTTDAKFKRVEDALSVAYAEIRGIKATLPTTYVRPEEVADLVEKTLRQAYDEPIEEKRRMYGAFLAGVITSPGGDYNEKLKMLRVLETIQPEHVRVLKALIHQPNPYKTTYGSRRQTLIEALGSTSDALADELVEDLVDLRIVTADEYRDDESALSGRHLVPRLTAFGKRFTAYLRD